MMERTYNLSKWRDTQRLDVSGFRLRVLNGEEDSAALTLAKTRNLTRVLGQAMMSIAAVDGQPCLPETSPAEAWNPRTRHFLLNAWNQLHLHPEEQMASFLGADGGFANWYDLQPHDEAVAESLRAAGVECEHGLSIRGFSMRELSAQDEVAIADASMHGGPAFAYARLTYAITEYETHDGERHRPDPDDKDRFVRDPWRGWSFHTCAFVHAAFQSLHEPMEAVADFLASHAGPTSSATDSEPAPGS